jgi:transcriptional regulator with XRE-family HTH domain
MATNRDEVMSARPLRAERWPTLRRARQDKEWTQQELAWRAGLSIASIRDLERGVRQNVRRTTWGKLSRALGVEGFSDLRRLENR